jgi:hypothetical protein
VTAATKTKGGVGSDPGTATLDEAGAVSGTRDRRWWCDHHQGWIGLEWVRILAHGEGELTSCVQCTPDD